MTTMPCTVAVTAPAAKSVLRNRPKCRAPANASHRAESSSARFAVGGESKGFGFGSFKLRASRNDDNTGSFGDGMYDTQASRDTNGRPPQDSYGFTREFDDDRQQSNFATSSSSSQSQSSRSAPPPDVTLLTSRETQALLPIGATGEQYAYFWGGPETATQRLGASLLGLVATVNVATFLAVPAVTFFLWAPVALAARRNSSARKGRNIGLWRAEVLSATPREAPPSPGFYDRDVNAPESWMLELIVGDRSGAVVDLRVPLRRSHADIAPGDFVEMVVSSDDNYFRRFEAVREAYFPDTDSWIGEYPFLDRRAMPKVSGRIARDAEARAEWESKNRRGSGGEVE